MAATLLVRAQRTPSPCDAHICEPGVGLALVCLVLDLGALGHVDTGVRQQQFVYGKYYSLTSDNQVDRSINTWYLFTDADHDPTVSQ